MKDRVCQDDCEAYKPDELEIAISPDDMEMAIRLGIVPDEIVNAGRSYVTLEEMHLHHMESDLHDMSFGITVWRIIGFALERGLPLPLGARQYLEQTAKGIDDWAFLNGHPSELKNVLKLHGKRKPTNDCNDPRWIYDAICQLREHNPKASVKSLVLMCIKQFPKVGEDEEKVRQKYYLGKKLAETGLDYKGRGRKRTISSAPSVMPDQEEVDF